MFLCCIQVRNLAVSHLGLGSFKFITEMLATSTTLRSFRRAISWKTEVRIMLSSYLPAWIIRYMLCMLPCLLVMVAWPIHREGTYYTSRRGMARLKMRNWLESSVRRLCHASSFLNHREASRQGHIESFRRYWEAGNTSWTWDWISFQTIKEL